MGVADLQHYELTPSGERAYESLKSREDKGELKVASDPWELMVHLGYILAEGSLNYCPEPSKRKYTDLLLRKGYIKPVGDVNSTLGELEKIDLGMARALRAYYKISKGDKISDKEIDLALRSLNRMYRMYGDDAFWSSIYDDKDLGREVSKMSEDTRHDKVLKIDAYIGAFHDYFYYGESHMGVSRLPENELRLLGRFASQVEAEGIDRPGTKGDE